MVSYVHFLPQRGSEGDELSVACVCMRFGRAAMVPTPHVDTDQLRIVTVHAAQMHVYFHALLANDVSKRLHTAHDEVAAVTERLFLPTES